MTSPLCWAWRRPGYLPASESVCSCGVTHCVTLLNSLLSACLPLSGFRGSVRALDGGACFPLSGFRGSARALDGGAVKNSKPHLWYGLLCLGRCLMAHGQVIGYDEIAFFPLKHQLGLGSKPDKDKFKIQGGLVSLVYNTWFCSILHTRSFVYEYSTSNWACIWIKIARVIFFKEKLKYLY